MAIDHQAAGRKCAGFGVERIFARRDFICVHELADFEGRAQATICPSGLACAIGLANHNYMIFSLASHSS
jgi:hypothetical protein